MRDEKSSKGSSVKVGTTSQIDSEEEDRRETEKVRSEVLAELIKKDEPLEC